MRTVKLESNVWKKVLRILEARHDVYIGKEYKTRRFIEGVLWITRTGSQWRHLPNAYGKWNSVFKRFTRWSVKGIWESIFEVAADDPDLENLMLDSTIVRAHSCAAGARKEDESYYLVEVENTQHLGRSVGGYSTKIHTVVDALGNPLRYILTAGQYHDVPLAAQLIEGLQADAILCDKAYDKDEFINNIQQRGAQVVIPPKSTRLDPRDCDYLLYKERHLVECFFNKLKRYRRIFSRFDKLARNYLSFIYLASIVFWLK